MRKRRMNDHNCRQRECRLAQQQQQLLWGEPASWGNSKVVMACRLQQVNASGPMQGCLLKLESWLQLKEGWNVTVCCSVLWCHPQVFALSTYCRHVLQLFPSFLASDETPPQTAFPSIVTWASTILRLYSADVHGIITFRTLTMQVSYTIIPCLTACYGA